MIAAAFLIGCSADPASLVDVVIRLPGPARTLSEAEVAVDYSRSGARPAGTGSPSCTALPPGVEAEFHDDGAGRLDVLLRSRIGFSPPLDLIACRMVTVSGASGPARVQAGLDIELVRATALDGETVGEKRLSAVLPGARARWAGGDSGGREPRDTGSSARSQAAVGERPQTGTLGFPRPASPAGGTRGRAASPAHEGRGRGSGASRARPLDRIEDARVRSPQLGAEAPTAGERAPTAAPGIPTVLNTQPSGGEFSGGSSGGAPADGGGSVGTLDPSTALPTHDYQITVSVLSSAEDLGALQVDVDFLGSSGAFLGRGASVSCTNLVAGALAAFNRQDQGVKAGFIAMNGIPTPGPIATCKFKSRENVSVQSFSVQVTDASDTESKQLDPPPFVAVNDVVALN